MAPHKGTDLAFTSGFRRSPTYRDVRAKTPWKWLEGKRVDDNIGSYWRVHDKLYDFSEFVVNHPGGSDWLLATQGTDITEAFETSHISTLPEKMLSKYYVRDTSEPRVSPYTFRDDGFYKTLKRKVRPILQKVGRGPGWKIIFIQDGLVAMFFALAVVAALMEFFLVAAASGVVLAMAAVCAHNFLHQKDNWRMYYFDLASFSSSDSRVSHVLSHHLFSNTIYDYEIAAREPVFEFLPKRSKNLLQRYGSHVYFSLLVPIMFYGDIIKRIVFLIVEPRRARSENFLPLLPLAVFCWCASSVGTGLMLWLVMKASCGLCYAFVGLTAGHHHPDIYHEGDAMRKDFDWGLCQLDAVRDKVEVTGNLFLVCTTFGDHSLHHLFPTVDHSKLNYLYPALYETCEEFKYPFKFMTQWELVRGKYLQMANVTPNTIPPDYDQKEE